MISCLYACIFIHHRNWIYAFVTRYWIVLSEKNYAVFSLLNIFFSYFFFLLLIFILYSKFRTLESGTILWYYCSLSHYLRRSLSLSFFPRRLLSYSSFLSAHRFLFFFFPILIILFSFYLFKCRFSFLIFIFFFFLIFLLVKWDIYLQVEIQL